MKFLEDFWKARSEQAVQRMLFANEPDFYADTTPPWIMLVCGPFVQCLLCIARIGWLAAGRLAVRRRRRSIAICVICRLVSLGHFPKHFTVERWLPCCGCNSTTVVVASML